MTMKSNCRGYTERSKPVNKLTRELRRSFQIMIIAMKNIKYVNRILSGGDSYSDQMA